MKKRTNHYRLLIFLISSIIATTSLQPSTIKRKNNKKEIYNILAHNTTSKTNIYNLYNIIIKDFNIDKEKLINNKLNYLYHNLIKTNNKYYQDYLKTLTGQYLSITDIDNTIPQGITCYEDYIIFSAYNENKSLNSYLYIIDKNNHLINKVELDNNSHVGGIAYDKDNKLLWITIKDKLYGYDINDILTKSKIKKKYETHNLDNIGNYSFVYYNNKKLYIGNYKFCDNSIIKVYTMKKNPKNNNIIFKPETTLCIPSKTQGIAFLTDNNNEYMILSRSCNIFESSEILIYEYNKDTHNYTNNYISRIECPPMLEEIAITNNQDLIAIYESCAQKYRDCLININHIYYSNIKKRLIPNKNKAFTLKK
ncbi:MAG: hypothetical protein VZS44_04430 [Bacilli bacterium]|nr:hypothetical protein [Bacilli bacterium]